MFHDGSEQASSGLRSTGSEYALDDPLVVALAELVKEFKARKTRAPRNLTDDEFDDNQYAIENGDTGIY